MRSKKQKGPKLLFDFSRGTCGSYFGNELHSLYRVVQAQDGVFHVKEAHMVASHRFASSGAAFRRPLHSNGTTYFSPESNRSFTHSICDSLDCWRAAEQEVDLRSATLKKTVSRDTVASGNTLEAAMKSQKTCDTRQIFLSLIQ